MLNRLILKVTEFQLTLPKRLSTVIKNILGGIMAPPCQIGLKFLIVMLIFSMGNFCTNNLFPLIFYCRQIFLAFFVQAIFQMIFDASLGNLLMVCPLGQHSIDSKFFSFWKQFAEIFCCPILVKNLTTRNLFRGITELNPRNLQLLKIFTRKWEIHAANFRQNMGSLRPQKVACIPQ